MFAGSPEASIELIRDLGNPRVYTSPINAAMSREDLQRSRFGVASLEYIGNVVTPETEGIQPLPPICSREACRDTPRSSRSPTASSCSARRPRAG